MDKIISMPLGVADKFNSITNLDSNEWFATTDPQDGRVGSGGGTAWAIAQCARSHNLTISEYLKSDKHIMIHAGGQSRRLTAYGPSGKILTPIPIFRWCRSQQIDQTLLTLITQDYEQLMSKAGDGQNTLVASGDAWNFMPQIPAVPVADVVCYGIWMPPQAVTHHGAFFAKRESPQVLDFMLQKPTHATIEELSATHIFLMDCGLWILSDRAMEVLMRKCGFDGNDFSGGRPSYYDLYSTFGTALGANPSLRDEDIEREKLSVAIVAIDGGEFYHLGTSSELISSMERIQNRIVDQRNVWHTKVKPQASIFVQNANCSFNFSEHNNNIWIENSVVGKHWTLTSHNIVTGVPNNDWNITLNKYCCLDIIPINNDEWCIRPYGINDAFKGAVGNDDTTYIGIPFNEWLKKHNVTLEELNIAPDVDIQSAQIFPITKNLNSNIINWLLSNCNSDIAKTEYISSHRISADEISKCINLDRLFAQRKQLLCQNLPMLAANKRSVFYQTDLKAMAKIFASEHIPLPEPLSSDEDIMTRMRDSMFRSEVLQLSGKDGHKEHEEAFRLLRDAIRHTAGKAPIPHCNVIADQVVCGRAPARLDLAGGWSDTPPICMHNGGHVVNIAVELNGQPPIQAYIRLLEENKIVMRSIDNGGVEVVESFDELINYNVVGSAFSIPKAALCLAGFHPDFCGKRYNTLKEQLQEFGGGMEISLLVAIPKGSGLGTSSILAGTILGTLSDFCGLKWNQTQICHLTLILEQLLTTGGGWQDQYGGIVGGLKLLSSEPGDQSEIDIRLLPERIFTHPKYQGRWLLYYTGITRVAKNILNEIARGMFLGEAKRINIIKEIKMLALDLADALQHDDFEKVGLMLRKSWNLNCALDSGTCTAEVKNITQVIDKYALGYKLLGAGGGGYMLICAKDNLSADLIRQTLTNNPPNKKARFVEMTLSKDGLQISRS
ncbi:MAG: bifunctional fucokinase/L-fucose-1-P-guanylyltransferase [Bacteroidales bacterium]|nr:bifunctional fucokinase/L-fucose-1-P-guanylyltransferase [Bacteroidales bacterium]